MAKQLDFKKIKECYTLVFDAQNPLVLGDSKKISLERCVFLFAYRWKNVYQLIKSHAKSYSSIKTSLYKRIVSHDCHHYKQCCYHQYHYFGTHKQYLDNMIINLVGHVLI